MLAMSSFGIIVLVSVVVLYLLAGLGYLYGMLDPGGDSFLDGGD